MPVSIPNILPYQSAAGTLSSTTAEIVTVSPFVSAVYLFVDDAAGAMVSFDGGVTYGFVGGQVYELIWARPSLAVRRPNREILVKAVAGTPTRYYRAF